MWAWQLTWHVMHPSSSLPFVSASHFHFRCHSFNHPSFHGEFSIKQCKQPIAKPPRTLLYCVIIVAGYNFKHLKLKTLSQQLFFIFFSPFLPPFSIHSTWLGNLQNIIVQNKSRFILHQPGKQCRRRSYVLSPPFYSADLLHFSSSFHIHVHQLCGGLCVAVYKHAL